MSGVEFKDQLVREAAAAPEPSGEKADSECSCGTGCHVHPIRLLESIFLVGVGFLALVQFSSSSAQAAADAVGFWYVALLAVGLRALAGSATLLLAIHLILRLWHARSQSGWNRYRAVVVIVAIICLVLCLTSVLVLWPEARRLEGAIFAEFGASDPPDPTRTPISFTNWLLASPLFLGPYWPYWRLAGGFQVDTHTYLTGIERKPGWSQTCEDRDFLDELALDVRFPRQVDDGQLAPIIFHIHGGQWITLDKDWIPFNSAYFLDRGYALVTSQYSFWCDGFSIPDMVVQLTAALDYVRANATRWGFNPDRIFLTGESAGGTLALMLAYTLNSSTCGGWKTCGIKGVFNSYGRTQLSRISELSDPISNLSTLTGTEDEAKQKEGFPLHHVTSDVPPTVTFHGTWDSIVPFRSGELLHERLKAAEVKQLLIPAATCQHCLDAGFYAGAAQMYRFAFERFIALRAWDED